MPTTGFVESSGTIVSVGAGILASLFALSPRFSREERNFFLVALVVLFGAAFCGSTGVLGMLFLPVIVVVSTGLVLFAVKLIRGVGTNWLRLAALLFYAVLFAMPLVSTVMMIVWLINESGAPGLSK